MPSPPYTQSKTPLAKNYPFLEMSVGRQITSGVTISLSLSPGSSYCNTRRGSNTSSNYLRVSLRGKERERFTVKIFLADLRNILFAV